MMFILEMLVLAVVSFIQNMAFTAVSRSRNSADLLHHAKCAVASNGIWFGCQVLIWAQVWRAIHEGAWWQLVIAGAIYVGATTAGSVLMMRHMLKTETGKRRVGARAE